MKTKVEYHETRDHSLTDGLCAKTAELYGTGERVYLWAASQADAIKLNERLWTLDDQSFIPHGLWSGEEGFGDPVAVGWLGGVNPNGAGVLVIAGDHGGEELTATARLFARVVDLVPARDEAGKRAARERFRALREGGFSPEFIK